MATKFSVYCDRVMEAGWLFAALSIPLFFDIYSSRVFEPDKLTLLRSIAVVVAAAWLAKMIETGFVDFRAGRGSILRQLHEANPLTIPVLLLVAIYLISTLASVAAYVSIWGSYQRLQGTYSTFSYIVIFAAMLHALKTRAQLERLLTLIILTSLPIAAYGWIQHFRLDPLPWGGDVSERIASAMGNSIFVGAYLIMALPITVGRWMNTVAQVLREPVRKPASGDGSLSVSAVSSLKANGIKSNAQTTSDLPQLIVAGCYTFILAFQALAIFWTFSRGAWIGLLAGMFVFLFLFGVRRHVLWLWGGSIGLAIAGIIFLVVINLPSSPLASFRTVPGIGRLGTIFDEEQGTNKVRFLIWEGAAQLVSPHEPIGFGPYTDVFNVVRPLIGYGPESMYVAYNKFYPPDLAHLEARNASPDRSHNETFDSLVITGVIGFIVYLGLFGSVFYYGFKWLGLAGEKRDRYIFMVCWIVGGAIGGAVPIVLEGTPRFVGVALPVGLLFGLLTYVISQALYFKRGRPMPPMSEDQLLLLALIGAIVAHFAEIHFGIAIASTRTYFWMYVALLVLVGYRLRQPMAAEAPLTVQQSAPAIKVSERLAAILPFPARGAWFGWKSTPALAALANTSTTAPLMFARKRRREKVALGRGAATAIAQTRAAPPLSSWVNAVIVYGLLLAAMLTIMVFNFVSPSFGAAANSTWILALFVFTVLVACLTLLAQVQTQFGAKAKPSDWLNRFLLIALIGITPVAVYTVIHLPRLTQRPGMNALEAISTIADSITLFYAFFFLLMLVLAIFLMQEVPTPVSTLREPFFGLIYLALAVVCGIIIITTNLNSIRADIFYKQGLNFDGQRQWDGSLRMYEEAIKLAPEQDFYYLFYGRAFLEKAKVTNDPKQRADLLETSRRQLVRARELNPLNTDHTANLARLYRTWAEVTPDQSKRTELLNRSVEYYEQALILSPHNAQIYDEYGSVHVMLGQLDKAIAKYQESLKIDSEFAQTYMLLGDAYLSKPDKPDYDNAINAYQQALKYDPSNMQAHSALGLIYSRQEKYEQAINENLAVVSKQSNDLPSLRNLALLYEKVGRLNEALVFAQRALAVAGEQDKPALQAYIAQLQVKIQQPK